VPELAKKLQELRGALTQYEVERQTGIRRSALNSYEKGKHLPTSKTLEKLAAFYQIPYRELRIPYYYDYYGANPSEYEIILAWAKMILEDKTPSNQ
jgi:transcriptional regulator with XRE-family HTH domain